MARSRHAAAATCVVRQCDVTNMAAPFGTYSRFASVSRKVGSCLFKSVLVAQAATCGDKMDSERPTKV